MGGGCNVAHAHKPFQFVNAFGQLRDEAKQFFVLFFGGRAVGRTRYSTAIAAFAIGSEYVAAGRPTTGVLRNNILAVQLHAKGCAEVPIFIAADRRIQGRVLTKDGLPAPDIKVEVRHPQEMSGNSVKTDQKRPRGRRSHTALISTIRTLARNHPDLLAKIAPTAASEKAVWRAPASSTTFPGTRFYVR